jgi:hypothetical protein
MRDYQLISPSLEGVLRHDSVVYEGIKRPEELLRIMDGPATKGPQNPDERHGYSETDQKIIEQYFHDIYGIFMKNLSHFVLDSDIREEEVLKLQAFLQELIKIKKLMRTTFTIEH